MLIGLVLYAGIWGCNTGSTPIALDLMENNTVTDKESQASAPSCHIHLLSIEDRRLRKNDVGQMNTHPILAKNLKEWLRENLVAHLGPILVLEYTQTPTSTSPVIQLALSLKKMYHHLLLSTQSAIVALEVRLSQDGIYSLPYIIRGRNTSVNWTGSKDSIQDSFNEAIGSALNELSSHLNQRCSA
ncbi:MAG: hypothetical protein GKS05_03405 [Nitrospirales bacterium]|nr:hypothetical protein [Nitrospirales bacterium]